METRLANENKMANSSSFSFCVKDLTEVKLEINKFVVKIRAKQQSFIKLEKLFQS
jgi:hypothetical protein